MEKQQTHKWLTRSLVQWLIILTYAYMLYHSNLALSTISGISHMLMPFFVGFGMAYLMNILVARVEMSLLKRFKGTVHLTKKGYSVIVLFMYILVLAAFVGVLILLIPLIVGSIESIITQLMQVDTLKLNNDIAKVMSRFTSKPYELSDLLEYITGSLTKWLNSFKDVLPQLMGATKQVVSLILNFILGSIISIYMLLNKSNYISECKRVVLAYMGVKKSALLFDVAAKMHKAFTDFISTIILGAVFVSSITLFGTTLMGISNTLLIAVVIAIGNLIPFFGPILGLIIAIILVAISNPDKLIMYVIFAIALQQFDANVMNPKLVGDKLGLDGLLVIFAVIIMSGLFGFFGTLVGVPVFAVLYFLFRDSVDKRILKQEAEL